MKLFALIGVLFAGFVLGGCASLDRGISSVSESEQLNTICNVAPAVHVAFVAIATQTTVSPAVMQKEEQAYAVLQQICTDRPANVVEALKTALNAYRTILDASDTVSVVAAR